MLPLFGENLGTGFQVFLISFGETLADWTIQVQHAKQITLFDQKRILSAVVVKVFSCGWRLSIVYVGS